MSGPDDSDDHYQRLLTTLQLYAIPLSLCSFAYVYERGSTWVQGYYGLEV